MSVPNLELQREVREVQQLQETVTKLEQKLERHITGTSFLISSVDEVNLNDLLIKAVKFGTAQQVFFFLQNGANIEYSRKRKKPIHLAVIWDKPRILEILIENSASIDAHGEDQKTALHFAVTRNHLECAKILIGKGANLECLDRSLMTPIQYAASDGFDDMIKLLLQKRVNVNAHQDINNMTGLHLAASNGHLSTVKLLVSNGANKALENVDRKTALDLAIASNHKLVVDFL